MKGIKKLLVILSLAIACFIVSDLFLPELPVIHLAEAASVKLNKSKITMTEGETYKLKISGTKEKAKWSSSDKSVAKVNKNGKVTAVKTGKATITAKVGSAKYKCKVTVKAAAVAKPTETPTETPTEAPIETSKDTIIQDLYYYAGPEMKFEMAKETSNGWWRKFSGQAEDFTIIKNYIKMLAEKNDVLELNPEYEKKIISTFYTASLVYKGSAKVGDTMEQLFADSNRGHITIYVKVDATKLEGDIRISEGLEFGDLGYRSDGSIESVKQLDDPSLKLTEKNGSYTYGKLTTKLGQASVLRDGVQYGTNEVSVTRNLSTNKEEVRIYYYYRNEGIAVALPYKSLMTGDKFTERNFSEFTKTSEQFIRNLESFFGWRYNYIFGVCHNGDFLLSYSDPINDLQKVFVKVLKWDESNGVAVFYIACEFSTEPYSYRVLAAARMTEKTNSTEETRKPTTTGTDSKPTEKPRHECTTCKGDKKVTCTACDGRGGHFEYESVTSYTGIGGGSTRIWKECTTCHGTGKIECRTCLGKGYW